MSFNGTEGLEVTLEDASRWTANFRTANPGAPKAFFYGKDNITKITKLGGYIGIRIYQGIDDSGAPCLILVGANSDGNDILSYVLERGVICPPYCGTANSLNS